MLVLRTANCPASLAGGSCAYQAQMERLQLPQDLRPIVLEQDRQRGLAIALSQGHHHQPTPPGVFVAFVYVAGMHSWGNPLHTARRPWIVSMPQERAALYGRFFGRSCTRGLGRNKESIPPVNSPIPKAVVGHGAAPGHLPALVIHQAHSVRGTGDVTTPTKRGVGRRSSYSHVGCGASAPGGASLVPGESTGLRGQSERPRGRHVR
jgi:hypothetical protein